MIDSKLLPALNAAVDKLTKQLIDKQEQLRIRETSAGKMHDVRKMNRLRDEIKSLESRLARAERLQEAALCVPAVMEYKCVTGHRYIVNDPVVLRDGVAICPTCGSPAALYRVEGKA